MNAKICETCGDEFHREPQHTDYVWEKKRHCGIRCQNTAARRAYKERVESGGWDRRGNWQSRTGEPPKEVLAEIEQRKAECRAKHFQGLVFAGED